MAYELVSAMNLIMQRMNNEEAYESWIWLVPDEASIDELMDIANDEEFRNEVSEKFVQIIKAYGDDGIVW